MKNKMLLLGIVLALLSLSAQALAYVNKSTEATWINSANPATNYGTFDFIYSQSRTTARVEGFLMFNLSQFATYKSIASLNFSYWTDDLLDVVSGITAEFYYCDDSFNDKQLTWANKDTLITHCDASPFYSKKSNLYVADKKYNITGLETKINADADGIFTVKINMSPSHYDANPRYVEIRNHRYAHSEPFLNFTLLPDFNISVINAYNGSKIYNFTVEINNGSVVTNITTRNGSVFWTKGQTINITVFNITDFDTYDYFNRTVAEIDTYASIEVDAWKALLYVYAEENATGNTLENFNSTIGGQFNTSRNNYTISYLNNGTFFYDARANYFSDNLSGYVRLEGLEQQVLTLNFTRSRISHLNFTDKLTGNALSGASVTITYPDSSQVSRTTNAEGYVNFSYGSFGNYTVDFEMQGYITTEIIELLNLSTAPLNTSYNISRANLIVRLFDRETGDVFTNKTEIVLTDVLNGTTYNGTFYITNLSLVSGTYNLVASSAGYYTEQRTVTFSNKENLTVDFYLLNLTGTSTGTLFVTTLNEFYITLPETRVTLLEYDIGTASFITISECYSNANGECAFAVELNTKKYILMGQKTIEGFTYTDQTSDNGFFVNVDEDVIQLFLRLTDSYTTSEFSKLSYNIDDNLNQIYARQTNATSINVTFSTTGDVTTVCLDYLVVNGSDKTSEDQTCVSSSVGIIQKTYTLNRNNTYEIQVYQLIDSYQVVFFRKIVNKLASFEQTLEDEGWLRYLIIVPFIALLALSNYLKNIYIFIIGAPVSAWIEVSFFSAIFLPEIATIITFICITLFFLARKKAEGV